MKMADRTPKPGFILPGDEWFTREDVADLVDDARTDAATFLIVGAFVGVVIFAVGIAIGTWVL